MSQVAHQAGTYVWFQLHKVTRSISTPPWMSECDVSPSQGYLPALYTWVERGTVRVKWPAQEHNICDVPYQGPVSRRSRNVFAPGKPKQNLKQSCFIHVFLIWTEVLFIQEISGIHTSLFLDTDELKMALQAGKVSGTLKKRALGLEPRPTSALAMRTSCLRRYRYNAGVVVCSRIRSTSANVSFFCLLWRQLQETVLSLFCEQVTCMCRLLWYVERNIYLLHCVPLVCQQTTKRSIPMLFVRGDGVILVSPPLRVGL